MKKRILVEKREEGYPDEDKIITGSVQNEEAKTNWRARWGRDGWTEEGGRQALATENFTSAAGG